jgi:sterol desaturase/sphingolipid hydroxylase (fatty acid hydroxylase superfamily)
MLTTFKMLYAPIFFGGFAVAALTLVQMGAGLFWLPVLVVLAIALSLIAESFAPYEPLWNKSLKDRQRDLIHSFVNEGSIVGMVALLPVIVGLVPWPSVWPAGLPLWIEVVAAVTLLDIGITLVHFASHRVDWLWRFHAVHHSVKRMYGFNGLLKHPVHQTMEITGGALPWLLVGVPSDVAAIAATFVAIQLLLQHSNVDMKIGPLKFIWAVAPVHRHHHVASAERGDVNFGLFFTFWDVMLGTACFSTSKDVRAGSIGIEDRPDYPHEYLAQLVEPFR